MMTTKTKATSATTTTMHDWWQPTNEPSSTSATAAASLGGVVSYSATRLHRWPANWRYGASQMARPVDVRWDTDLCALFWLYVCVCVCGNARLWLLLCCCWGWCGWWLWMSCWAVNDAAACCRCSAIYICCCYSIFCACGCIWFVATCVQQKRKFYNKKQIMSAHINFSFQ